MFQFGEVVLLEHPYSDLIGVKLRPAVVIRDTNDVDFIVARITSQTAYSLFDVTIADWQAAGLLKPSIIRVDKLTTLETNLVKREMGKRSPGDLSSYQHASKNFLESNFLHHPLHQIP